MEKIPLVGTACRGLQSLFIARGASEEEKERVVESIKERQRAIEVNQQDYNPICLFPETTTSNGSALLKFKRGAFQGLRTVVPVIARVNKRMVMPAYDAIEFFPLLIIYYSSFCMYNLNLMIMPEFTPTEWMLQNHREKSPEGHDWEIFAECVREAMGRHGNLILDYRSIRDKLAYEEFMCGHVDELTVDGKTFYYPNSRNTDSFRPPTEADSLLIQSRIKQSEASGENV